MPNKTVITVRIDSGLLVRQRLTGPAEVDWLP
jgi:hypothetical protein